MIAQRVEILPESKLTQLLRTTEQLGRMLNNLRRALTP